MRSLILPFLICLAALPSFAQGQGEQEPEHYMETGRKHVWPQIPVPPVGTPDATLSVYFDLVGRTRSRAVTVNEPFEFFLVARGAHVGVLSWETKLTIDAPLRIVEEELGAEIRIGTDGEYRVSFTKPQDCLIGDQVVLAKFKAILLEEGHSDLVIHLGPVQGSTVRDPDRPGYVMCKLPPEARPFQFEAVAAVVNPEQLRLPDERPAADLFRPERARN